MIEVVTFGGYPVDMVLAISETTPSITERLKLLGVTDEEIDDIELDGDFGITVMVGPKVLVRMEAFDGSAEHFGCLTHELTHAVWTLMEHVGIPPHRKTEEAYAYAIQDLTAKIILLVRPR